MKNDEQRNYRMTDPDLCMFVSNLVQYMTRDAVEFTAKNVPPTATTALEVLGNAFEVFPSDEFYLADVMLATQQKNQYRASCELKVRDIVGCAKLKWGDKSPQVSKFGARGAANESEKAFLTTCRLVVTVATSYLTDLTPYGLTLLQITALEDEAQLFEDSMNAHANAVFLRDSKSRERVEKGNELYGFVQLYCETGKVIWDDVDLAKYNNYVIYETSPGVPLKIQNMAFAAASNTISWDTEASATSYELVFSLDTPTRLWVQVYLGANNSFVHVYGPSTILYKCRGLNDNGYGYWSDELIVTRP